MPRIQLYLDKHEYAWAKSKPKGYLRKILGKALKNEQISYVSSLRSVKESSKEVGGGK